MPLIPTTYGTLVEHSARDVHVAEEHLLDCLARLAKPDYRKAQLTIDRIHKLWIGDDGTRSRRGVRLMPTPQAVRAVARLVHDERVAVRRQVFVALGAAGDAALEAADEIALGLADPDPTMRHGAVRLFIPLRPPDTELPEGALPNKLDLPERLIPALRERLCDSVWSVRWSAVISLSGTLADEELADALLQSVPGTGYQESWLRAARALETMPEALADRVADIEDAERSRWQTDR